MELTRRYAAGGSVSLCRGEGEGGRARGDRWPVGLHAVGTSARCARFCSAVFPTPRACSDNNKGTPVARSRGRAGSRGRGRGPRQPSHERATGSAGPHTRPRGPNTLACRDDELHVEVRHPYSPVRCRPARGPAAGTRGSPVTAAAHWTYGPASSAARRGHRTPSPPRLRRPRRRPPAKRRRSQGVTLTADRCSLLGPYPPSPHP